MKIACIALNSNLINIDEQTKIINYLNTKLYEIGENISLISYFPNSQEGVRNIFSNSYDLIFFIGTNDAIYNHNIKENLARIFGDKLSSHESSYSSLSKYCNKNNIVFSMLEETEVMLPTKSIPLVSNDYYSNGFMYKHNSTYIVYLPENLDFVKFNYVSYVLPLICDLVGNYYEYQVVKCFGLLEKDIRSVIAEYFVKNEVNINIINNGLDTSIYIRYKKDANLVDVQNIIANIISKLNKFIYSLEDVSIYQMASDLLNLYHKTLCIGETITFGNITKQLSQINPNNIKSTNVYLDYDTMINELNIDKKVIDQFGKYSVNVIYELSNALLEKTSSDNVLFVLADSNNPEICYMAVGDIDGIHVYKNKILANSESIESISKTAIFYLIKKLKQNSLHFE